MIFEKYQNMCYFEPRKAMHHFHNLPNLWPKNTKRDVCWHFE